MSVILDSVQHKIFVNDVVKRPYKVVSIPQKQKILITQYNESGLQSRIITPKVDINNTQLKINILPTTNYVAVVENPRAEIITVAQQGPSGAAGAAEKFIHLQTVNSAEWIVNHNLGSKPMAEVLSVGGEAIIAEIQHITDNQLRVYLSAPMQGQVMCI